jgi:hypothetical protein
MPPKVLLSFSNWLFKGQQWYSMPSFNSLSMDIESISPSNYFVRVP